MSFLFAWMVSALGLIVLAGWIGRQARFEALDDAPTYWGILIDSRERFSLNRLQLVMWTLLILSNFIGLLVVNLVSDPGAALAIPDEILGLLGISAASATVAGAVKDGKDATRPQKIAGGKGFFARIQTRGVLPPGFNVADMAQKPGFSQIFLEEEGVQSKNRVVSVMKFQNFFFTLALGAVYVVLAVKAGGYPAFDRQVLWLIGISQSGYIGGKLPNKD
jgi:hypothetical protein